MKRAHSRVRRDMFKQFRQTNVGNFWNSTPCTFTSSRRGRNINRACDLKLGNTMGGSYSRERYHPWYLYFGLRECGCLKVLGMKRERSRRESSSAVRHSEENKNQSVGKNHPSTEIRLAIISLCFFSIRSRYHSFSPSIRPVRTRDSCQERHLEVVHSNNIQDVQKVLR